MFCAGRESFFAWLGRDCEVNEEGLLMIFIVIISFFVDWIGFFRRGRVGGRRRWRRGRNTKNSTRLDLTRRETKRLLTNSYTNIFQQHPHCSHISSLLFSRTLQKVPSVICIITLAWVFPFFLSLFCTRSGSTGRR